MAFHTKKDFSALCGIKSGDLYNYMKRGKVIVENNLLDDKNPINRTFLDKSIAKKPVLAAKKTIDKKVNVVAPREYNEAEETLSKMLKEKTVLESEQKRNAITLQKIDIQKKRGELIPTYSVNNLFVQHSESIKTAYMEGSDNLIVILAQKHQLSATDVADIRTMFTGIVNKAVDSAIDSTLRQIKTIVREFSAKKGVGQSES